MGDWDLYCALCAADTCPAGADSIGSTNPAMLAIRRAIVHAAKERVESGEEAFPSPSFEEEDGEHLDEAEVDWDWDDESCAYDPGLVSVESTKWLGYVLCLGLNAKAGRYVRRGARVGCRACWWSAAKRLT